VLDAVEREMRKPVATTRPGWKRGVGYAAMFHVGGGARVYRSDGCGAILKLDDFGKVSLITGPAKIGQGSETVLAMIVRRGARRAARASRLSTATPPPSSHGTWACTPAGTFHCRQCRPAGRA